MSTSFLRRGAHRAELNIDTTLGASHKEVFKEAMRMGVKIAFGTDVGAYEHGTSAREFVRMVDYGMKPIDAIRSAPWEGSPL